MKKIILSIIATCLLQIGFGQLNIGSGASWITTGNASVVIQDMNLINNGTLVPGTGSFKFTGTQDYGITGVNLSSFYILEIAKTNNAKVLLARDISVASSINFISGLLDLLSSKAVLATGANIAGETETNRIIGGTGFIEVTQNLNSPNVTNPGNLGAFISSSVNLGSVTIRRGHLPQSGTGLTSGIARYYSIIPTINVNLNATLRLKYFDAELNGQTEAGLVIYQSTNSGGNWTNLSRTSNSTNSNYVEKTGVASLSFQTLANGVAVADGVAGLVFTGQRKKATEITLKWITQSETNMSGYQIQRRQDNEIDFTDRAFINSTAPGGNSLAALSYQSVDANNFTGASYYRLKIVTLSNIITYSDIIAIVPKVKGGGNPNNLTASETDAVVSTAAKSLPTTNTINKKITVGPNPNYGNFWFTVNGIEKETVASLYTIDGKMVKQFRVVNMMQQPVNNLNSGIYILKIPGFDGTKIVVQGDSRKGISTTPTNDNKNLD